MANQEEGKLVVQQSARRSSGARTILVLIIILALAGVIVYLLSLLNSRKYFLVPEGGELVVKKGIFFPVGQDTYRPADPKEAELYQPIEIPEQLRSSAPLQFEDLPSLNRELASFMMQHAEKMVFTEDEKTYQRGLQYLERASRLHGLDPQQLEKLRAMRADVDYLEAKRAYLGVEKTLEVALQKFRKAEALGSGRFNDAADWSQKIIRLLDIIRSAKNEIANPAPPPPAPAPAVETPAAVQ